jgi:hypothetical protein
LLTGGFSKEILGRFISSAKEKGLTVEVARQRFSLNECHCSPFVLPPRVIAYCSEVAQAEVLAKEIDIQFVGVLASSYVSKGATLLEWRDSIKDVGISSDGLNAPTPVNGWFSLFDYTMENYSNEKYDIPSPIEISEFFSPCIRKRSRDYDSYHKTYELIDKKEEKAYPIQDRSWAIWSMYDLSQKGDMFSGKKFEIAYDERFGAMILPAALKLPKIFSRAAVLCSGKIPTHINSCDPYNIMNDKSSEYGLSMRPYENKEGCVGYFEVPRYMAEEIARKLCATLKDYSIALLSHS